MSSHVSESIYQALASIRLVDPHSHINPHDPASHTLADLLGYHYYTELAHSAGMPKAQIEDRSIGPKELVSRLVQRLPAIENTAQYRWLIELCRTFYGFDSDRIDASNWEYLYDAAESRMRAADWPQMVLEQSNVEAVFLTNDFDDKLVGFDTETYIPCLRTDELVFHLHKRSVQQRLEESTGVELDGSLTSLRQALTRRFEHFVSHGARACAISLPPGFTPAQVSDGRAASALEDVLSRTEQADTANRDALSRRVFWTLAELCDEFGLPFDLMIGVNRGVYAGGVYQGQDLYDSRVSLIQYRELFNAFPNVKFPISVLASVTNQELVSYAWIFPNVITNGHWWYSNTPSFIARDAAVRLEAVPQTKQIAYYSDAYKLEFIWPKFDMYRRILADLLADNFVRRNGWGEERAIELGRKILRDNVDEIFPRPDTSRNRKATTDPGDVLVIDSDDSNSTIVGTTGIAAAGSAVATAEASGFEIDDVELVDDVEACEDMTLDENATLGDAEEPNQTVDESGAFETVVDDSVEMTGELDDVEMEDSEPARANLENPEEFPSDIETIEESTNYETLPSDTGYFDEPATASEAETDSIDAADASFETIDSSNVERTAEDMEWLLDAPDDVPEISGLIEPSELLGTSDLAESLEPVELDSVPSDDEIRSLPLDDVELRDYAAELVGLDPDRISGEFDSEPLDVGDLLGDVAENELLGDASSKASDASDEPKIRMLRGEESFSPDEDSLQMSSNPNTGELVFPVDGDEASAVTDETSDEWPIDAADINPSGGNKLDVAEFSTEVALDGLLSDDLESTLDDDDWTAKPSDLMHDDPESASGDDDKP